MDNLFFFDKISLQNFECFILQGNATIFKPIKRIEPI